MAYTFARNGMEYGEPISFASTLSTLAGKADQWGPRYRVKPSKAEPWSEEMGRPLMLLKVARAMRKAAWGGLIKVEVGTNRSYSATFLIRKQAPKPASEPLRMYTGAIVDLTRGNERIAKAAEYAKQKCPRVQCSGWVYTRNVAGSSTWSQHSNFPTGGNAIDLTVYNGDNHNNGIAMDATQDVCDVLVAAARAGHLQLNRVIFRDQQYRAPGFAATGYTGTFHTHVHAEGAPLQSGTPVDAA